jgi:hypothetical protein
MISGPFFKAGQVLMLDSVVRSRLNSNDFSHHLQDHFYSSAYSTQPGRSAYETTLCIILCFVLQVCVGTLDEVVC